MIDPRTVYVAIPCGDGRMMAETAGSLVACGGKFAALSIKCECSHVSLVRNMIADDFLQACEQRAFEWLVAIDSDIAFTPDDWSMLMEPADPDYEHREGAPTPTRTMIGGIVGRGKDGSLLRAQQCADILVCAEYPYKNDALTPVKLGMGFVRIHRSVFETIAGLKHDDGTSRCWQSTHEGRLITDYYPSGPFISQLIPNGEWKGEDHGFFTLCMLAGIIPRIERRTRLTHIGRKGYVYQADVAAGQ